MKKLYLVIIATVFNSFCSNADKIIDKEMSKIKRDTETYISADARAATENEAYNMALQMLTTLVADYMKTEYNGLQIPDTVMSGLYDRLTSHADNQRYHVMVYVKKTALKSIGDSKNAKNNSNTCNVEPVFEKEKLSSAVRPDTEPAVEVVQSPLHPTLSLIAAQKNRTELNVTIKSLNRDGKIQGASQFPVGLSRYYVVVVNTEGYLAAILEHDNGTWSNVITETPDNPANYDNCKAIWFTLSSDK